MLKVYLPYSKSTIVQRFGENANPLYAGQGLKGHTSYDWSVPYGSPIPNCVADSYCYSLMHKDDPVLMDYRAVFFIVETDDGKAYEISYGHLSKITAEVGKTYQPGDIIGFTGNTGPVFQGQHEVTEAEKDHGSTAGTHLHGPQVRVLQKTKYTGQFKDYVMDETGKPFMRNGYFYGIPDYDNGYNGCVSMAQYSTETLATDWKAPVPVVDDPIIENGIQVAQKAVFAASGLPEGPQRSSLLKNIADFLSGISRFLGGNKN